MAVPILSRDLHIKTAGGRQAFGSIIAVTTLAFCAVVARLYTRIFMVKHAGPDDFVICVAMVVTAE